MLAKQRSLSIIMEVSLESSTTNYGAQFQKRQRGSVTALFLVCHYMTSRDTFVSLKSLSCETKNNTVKKRNNKHEINLLWLGTRRAFLPQWLASGSLVLQDFCDSSLSITSLLSWQRER